MNIKDRSKNRKNNKISIYLSFTDFYEECMLRPESYIN